MLYLYTQIYIYTFGKKIQGDICVAAINIPFLKNNLHYIYKFILCIHKRVIYIYINIYI